MKCKLFSGMLQDLAHLEKQINIWTENKSMIMRHVTQSQCMAKDDQVWITISVWWEWRDKF